MFRSILPSATSAATILLVAFFFIASTNILYSTAQTRDLDVAVDFPAEVRVGEDVQLHCDYQIGDNWQQLLSLKWYKDGHEFYRFIPGQNPSKQWFQTGGVRVDLNRSQNGTVMVTNATLYTQGLYRCEVQLDKPSHTKVIKRRIMKVIQ